METIQTTALLRSARIETFCHSNSSVKPSANAGGKKKNLKRNNINNNYTNCNWCVWNSD